MATIPGTPTSSIAESSCCEMARQEIRCRSRHDGTWLYLQIPNLLPHQHPERQKVLIKGGQLKDDQDMSTLNLKPGHNFMLIGTAEQGFKAPEKKTVFLEDMTSADLAKSVPPLVTQVNGSWFNLLGW